jgi:hypothetical protein
MEDRGRSASGIALFVRLAPSAPPGRGMIVHVEPVDERRTLTAAHAQLLLRLWREGSDVSRGAVSHPGSDLVAYFQGTGALVELCLSIGLVLSDVLS